MKIKMDRIIAHNKSYTHIILIPTPDHQCFTCKEPYDFEDGCDPICLTECGHTMGLQCFQKCTMRTRKNYPYRGNKPRAPYQLDEESSILSVLKWPRGTWWFRFTDLSVHLRFFRKPLLHGIKIREGINIWDLLQLNMTYILTSIEICMLLTVFLLSIKMELD
jgi:hypothetical protein